MPPTDELTKPLGLDPQRPPSRYRYALLGAAALVVAVGIGGAVWMTRSTGPTATATIAVGPAKPAVDPTSTGAVVARAAPVPDAPPTKVVGGPGLRELTPSSNVTDVGTVRIYDPSQPQPVALPTAPATGLTENGAYGPLPRIADSGLRPMDAYARPASITNGPRIAIVVGGIGLDATTTRDAIVNLPGTVTLALAPYGDTLKQTVTDARGAGHELLLQIPLEPYGYPKTDPGPNTLVAAATAKTNLDNLSWLLSRATSYVGVMNYMGAAFTSTVPPMQALLDAVGKRGLLYVDDGSSPRSIAGDAANGRVPFIKADLVLDPDLSPGAIDARLDQLIAIAKTRGFAIGTASAFPTTIDRIAAFARAASAKNVTLVPVSAVVGKPRT